MASWWSPQCTLNISTQQCALPTAGMLIRTFLACPCRISRHVSFSWSVQLYSIVASLQLGMKHSPGHGPTEPWWLCPIHSAVFPQTSCPTQALTSATSVVNSCHVSPVCWSVFLGTPCLILHGGFEPTYQQTLSSLVHPVMHLKSEHWVPHGGSGSIGQQAPEPLPPVYWWCP
jgi:hypothetical protein